MPKFQEISLKKLWAKEKKHNRIAPNTILLKDIIKNPLNLTEVDFFVAILGVGRRKGYRLGSCLETRFAVEFR